MGDYMVTIRVSIFYPALWLLLVIHVLIVGVDDNGLCFGEVKWFSVYLSSRY
ncbi:hypothetical protein C497_00045 [Halalkalicoccus jeotgali B3]|uniref:Transmembrane protein n=1 Tax=Halalkalicoccus jeotgali (strain DSM 18796 / CECT 7217 / JCM 14584 / KCTC 4019 / B3) TaxID=795797 RepID=D8JDA5_HALJB|nr:hypothetical protein HacjB3_19613 [Halalkalicoccus jeotgali B3]ELY41945.1 hypothetical protein C497_00045 [Halalkalicoccus jeotgali B3]